MQASADGDGLLGTDAAVGADGVYLQIEGERGGLLGRQAHHRAVLVLARVEGEGEHHWEASGESGEGGDARLLGIAERFEQQRVGFGTGLRLLEEGRSRVDAIDGDYFAGRADRREDGGAARGGFTREADAGAVERDDI